MGFNSWTKDQENFLLEKYYNLTTSEIISQIGHDDESIRRKARRLGLKPKSDFDNDRFLQMCSTVHNYQSKIK